MKHWLIRKFFPENSREENEKKKNFYFSSSHSSVASLSLLIFSRVIAMMAEIVTENEKVCDEASRHGVKSGSEKKVDF